MLNWVISSRTDKRALPLANRHYNRQNPNHSHFAPPGRAFVLVTEGEDAFWVTSWQYPEYVKHEWKDAWNCSAFRNEGTVLSSALITEAVAATRWRYGDAPAGGMITFVDAGKVKKKRDPGRCFRKAGFAEVGRTKGGLVVLQLKKEDMPQAVAPMKRQGELGNGWLVEEGGESARRQGGTSGEESRRVLVSPGHVSESVRNIEELFDGERSKGKDRCVVAPVNLSFLL